MTVQSLIEFREHLDALVQICDTQLPYSEYVCRSTDHLKLARAWFGKLANLAGEVSPYKNDGKRHKPSDIEPVAHTAKKIRNLKGLNQIEKIDWFREEITTMIRDFEVIADTVTSPAIPPVTALVSIYQHLTEARFWFGFELGRIRDNNKKP